PFGRLLFSHALPRLRPTYQETDMVVRKEKKIAVEPLRVKNPHAAGIDVHAEVHWVAVPPGSAPAPPKKRVTTWRMAFVPPKRSGACLDALGCPARLGHARAVTC